MKRMMIASLLLAGSLALTGCASQETQPFLQTEQTSPVSIKVTGEAEVDQYPAAVLEGKPAIMNTGSQAVYCCMKVEMPVFPLGTVALEADEPQDDPVPLIRCEVSDAWTLVRQTEEDGVCTTVYTYGTPTALQPGETTQELFNRWRVPNFRVHSGICGNYTYSELTAQGEKVRITGYAIQADHIGKNLMSELIWQLIAGEGDK